MQNCSLQDSVKQILADYLGEHNLRKTPERFTILQEIYDLTAHFDIESLYEHMKAKKYRVSRATLYNTIELLQDCNLIVKHQFNKSVAQYEKSFQSRQHDHLICNVCGNVEEFCDPRLYQIQIAAEKITKFKTSHHSLHFYGLCEACQNKKS
jgi:Fur family ferric uptake transcriptional regulator